MKVPSLFFLPLFIFTLFILEGHANQGTPSSSSFGRVPGKSQIFVFKPGFNRHFDGIGVVYREYEQTKFYELEAVQKKSTIHQGQVDLNRLFERKGLGSESQKAPKLEEIMLSTASISRGVATDTPYIRLYGIAGAGLTHSYATIGHFNREFHPTLTTKIGLSFKYGFMDIGWNLPILPIRYSLPAIGKGTFTFPRLLPISRVGLGMTF